MKKILLFSASWILVITFSAQAMFMRPDVEKVPTDRLITNLAQKIKDNPKNVQACYALARVHAIAFAKRQADFDVNRKDGLPFFGFQDRGFLPRGKVTAADETARGHLDKAIQFYTTALEIKADHLPSRVGLGWCQDHAGQKQAAIESYRKALDQSWGQEKKAGHIFGSSVAAEVGDYLLPLLDPQADADEIKRIAQIKAEVSRMPRAVTPLLVPLEDGLALGQLVNRQAAVPFDLDGSGVLRKWNWPTPKAGWLAYDPDGRREVRSGLQLFGAVTFWVFWANGYEALASLDDDQDGWLRGAELEGLVLWQDVNSNGQSEPGEVQPLSDHGISALGCRYQTHASGIPYHPDGAVLQDGRTRPTYDWISSAK